MPNDIRMYGPDTLLAFGPGEVELATKEGVAVFRLTRGFGCEAEAGLDADLRGG